MKYSKNCVLLAKNFDVRIFVRLLAKICAHFCAPFSQNMCTFVRFLKIFDVRIFVRLLAKICAHLSLELLDTLILWRKKATEEENLSQIGAKS